MGRERERGRWHLSNRLCNSLSLGSQRPVFSSHCGALPRVPQGVGQLMLCAKLGTVRSLAVWIPTATVWKDSLQREPGREKCSPSASAALIFCRSVRTLDQPISKAGSILTDGLNEMPHTGPASQPSMDWLEIGTDTCLSSETHCI